MALTAPTVLSAHFEEQRQQPRVVENWRSGLTGPVNVTMNAPLPIVVMQTGICEKTAVSDVMASRGDASQTITNLDALNCGKLGVCWKVDAGTTGLPSGGAASTQGEAGTLVNYWIIWKQVSYTAPSYS